MPDIIWLILGAAVGIAVGIVIARQIGKNNAKRSEQEAQSVIAEAKKQAETLKREAAVEAKDEALKLRQSVEAEKNERLKEARAAEDRLNQREKSLDHRSDSLDSREHQISSMQGQVEKRDRDLQETERELQRKRDELAQQHDEVNHRLEQVAGLTSDEAKTELLDNLKDEVTHESAAIIRESEARTKAEADKKSREILSLAIQRVAADHSAEITVSTIHIPSDDLKGRIIGREGRNIRAFEQLTGTNLIIDDTPECVTISCFDPVRREIGRVTMENLIADGRIHPARIEEMFKKAESYVNQKVQEAGEQAAFDTGVHDLHPELVHTLGRLLYRTSYGQNVLNHSLEVAYLSSVMASELGLDPIPAKRAGLCTTWARPSTTKWTAAMRLSAPIWHVVSARNPKSCMPSKRTTMTWNLTACSTCWCRQQTPFRPHGPARARKRLMHTSSDWRSLRKSPTPIKASSVPMPSRQGAKCA